MNIDSQGFETILHAAPRLYVVLAKLVLSKSQKNFITVP